MKSLNTGWNSEPRGRALKSHWWSTYGLWYLTDSSRNHWHFPILNCILFKLLILQLTFYVFDFLLHLHSSTVPTNPIIFDHFPNPSGSSITTSFRSHKNLNFWAQTTKPYRPYFHIRWFHLPKGVQVVLKQLPYMSGPVPKWNQVILEPVKPKTD